MLGGVSQLVWDSNAPGGMSPGLGNLQLHALLPAAHSDIAQTSAFIREALVATVRVSQTGAYSMGIASGSGAVVRLWLATALSWEAAADEASEGYKTPAVVATTVSPSPDAATFRSVADVMLTADTAYKLYSRTTTSRGRPHFHAIRLTGPDTATR